MRVLPEGPRATGADRHAVNRDSAPGGAAGIYVAEAVSQVPRLLSLQDREPHSPRYGSFDRDAWSWKFRDFPLGMAQTAVYPLALLWRHSFDGNPCFGNDRCLEWIAAGMERALSTQHRNGALDAWAPNEFDIGPTLGIAHGVAEALRLVKADLPPARVDRIAAGLRRAFDFGLGRRETHGFISNHLALFAVALLDAAELFDDDRYRQGASDMIAVILEGQSSEGWYREYGGPDPGYETLGIHHLATWWQRTRSAEVQRSLERAVECFSYFVHPDGSVGGVYGSRGTALYYPAGFEILASISPTARSVARFLRERIHRRNVVTPAVADLPNLVPMLYSYLEAALAATGSTAVEPLPCETLQGIRVFKDAGIVVAGGEQYYAVVGGATGGVCRVFDRGREELAHEDAGYLVRTSQGLTTSQARGLGSVSVDLESGVIRCDTPFAHLRHEYLTPGRMILLRILNLTAFRVSWLAGWFRRRIVRRLVTEVTAAPLRLQRTFHMGRDEIRVSDVITSTGSLNAVGLTLARNCTVVHAGSSRYFHPAELASLETPVNDPAVSSLNAGTPLTRGFEIRVRARASLPATSVPTDAP
jgi:hypothetical protein